MQRQLLTERSNFDRVMLQVQGERRRTLTADNAVVHCAKIIILIRYVFSLYQIFALTNDLNEKDDTIVKLKRREASLERMVFVNEKVHEQDALVRLQLGKRLEQVLLDKEEAYEELEQLQVRSNRDWRGVMSLKMTNMHISS